MKSIRLTLLFLLVSSIFAGCQKKYDCAPTPHGTGLIGSWQLTKRVCYCAPAPTPNETVTFTATTFTFFKDSRFARSGTYADTTVVLCGGVTPTPALRLTETAPNAWATNANIALAGDTLVLDYGSPCDAARDTYRRLP